MVARFQPELQDNCIARMWNGDWSGEKSHATAKVYGLCKIQIQDYDEEKLQVLGYWCELGLHK